MTKKDLRCLVEILKRNGYVVFEKTEQTKSLSSIIENSNLTVQTHNILLKYYVERGKDVFDLIMDVDNNSIRKYKNIGELRFNEIKEWVEKDLKSRLQKN